MCLVSIDVSYGHVPELLCKTILKKIKSLIYLSKQILVSLKKKRRYHPIILTIEGGKIKHWVFAAITL